MNLILYTCKAEKNRVDKSAYLTKIAEYSGSVRGELNLMNPEILINTDLSNLNAANYLYIPDFQRYYFVKDPISVRTGISVVPCHEDVLMSFKGSIKNQYAVVARNQNDYSLYIDDDQFKAYQNLEEGCITFSSGFTTSGFSFVLITAGNTDYVSEQ